MANIFRSDEVYKKPPKTLHNRDEIIPVRGVYVSGHNRPPYYNEPIISITGIASNPVNIYSMISTVVDNVDPVVNVINFDIDPTVDIAFYTLASSEAHDAGLNVINFDMDPTLTVDFFTKRGDETTDAVINIINLDMNPIIDITPSPIERNKQPPEPAILLTGIDSNSVTIITM